MTSFTQQTIDTLSSGQPAWLTAQRALAFKTFSALSLPTRRDVDWQRFDPAVRDALNLDKISLPLNPAEAGPSITETLTPLPADPALRDVIFCDLATALKKHGDLVREYLGKSIAPDEPRKFYSLHAAFWNAGALLYVPRGVQVTVPLEILYQFNGVPQGGTAGFPHTLVVIEAGAEATLVQRFISGSASVPLANVQGNASVPLANSDSSSKNASETLALPTQKSGTTPTTPSLHSSATEVFVKEGGRLHYISLQNFDKSVFDFTVKRAHVARDAEIDWVIGMFGASFQRYDIECVMEGQGGTSFMYGACVAGDRQQFGQFTKQHHTTGNTVSDLLFKNVLRDQAVSNYAGLIKVEKNANGTNAYQSNRNLVLSEHVKCDSRPILEIESNKLRCTHGATVGRLDEAQLYYLRSRGLDAEAAKQILIEAFLEPILARIKVESVRNEFAELVHNKVTR